MAGECRVRRAWRRLLVQGARTPKARHDILEACPASFQVVLHVQQRHLKEVQLFPGVRTAPVRHMLHAHMRTCPAAPRLCAVEHRRPEPPGRRGGALQASTAVLEPARHTARVVAPGVGGVGLQEHVARREAPACARVRVSARKGVCLRARAAAAGAPRQNGRPWTNTTSRCGPCRVGPARPAACFPCRLS